MRREYGKREFYEKFVLTLLARDSAEEKRGYGWKRMDPCHDRWMDGIKASLFLNILLSLPLIN